MRSFYHSMAVTLLLLTLSLGFGGCSTLTMDFKGENGQAFHVEVVDGPLADNISNVASSYEIGPDGSLRVAQGGGHTTNTKNQLTAVQVISENVRQAVIAGVGAAFGATVAGPLGAAVGAAGASAVKGKGPTAVTLP